MVYIYIYRKKVFIMNLTRNIDIFGVLVANVNYLV